MANPAVMKSGVAHDPNRDARANGAKAPSVLIPFQRASRHHVELMDDRAPSALTTSTQAIGPIEIPSYGFLRSLRLHFTCTTAGNSANVAYQADGPWSAIEEVVVTDVNGAPIFGPVSGYELYLINLFGGYEFLQDPSTDPAYSAVTSTGATGGSFAFMLQIPIEVTNRDGFGSLPNMNAASTYRLRVTLATSATVYSTGPTAAGTLRLRTYMECWSQPNPVDLRGRPQEQQPYGVGSTQYWSKQTFTINSGSNTLRFPRVGNLIRQQILVLRDGSAVRSTANFPDPIRFDHDGRTIYQIGSALLRTYLKERNGIIGSSLPAGVFQLDWCSEFDDKVGGELRDNYLPTTQASRLELSGSFGGAGTLAVLTNDIAPVGEVA